MTLDATPGGLVRAMAVMRRTGIDTTPQGDDVVRFGIANTEEDDGYVPSMAVTLTEETWLDMGAPDEITVAVFPGYVIETPNFDSVGSSYVSGGPL